MMMAGQMHPPFSFRSCRKENGPCTVQKKRTPFVALRHLRACALYGGFPRRCWQNQSAFCRLAPDRLVIQAVPRVWQLGKNFGVVDALPLRLLSLPLAWWATGDRATYVGPGSA